jgi:hypothetical protein
MPSTPWVHKVFVMLKTRETPYAMGDEGIRTEAQERDWILHVTVVWYFGDDVLLSEEKY